MQYVDINLNYKQFIDKRKFNIKMRNLFLKQIII